MEARGKILAKAGNQKGFKIEGQEGWFNATDAVVPYLAKFEKGTEVIVSYTKKGVSRSATKIVGVMGSGAAPETPKKDTGFVCEDCGTPLKDGKYKKCFPCNKKSPKFASKSTYDSPDRIASIQRGNALNAAASVLSGTEIVRTAKDVETVAELTKVLANIFLDYLREE